ncbi:MAG: preprotein translocase subunit SecA [Proteobacteria bacterium]|nr:preprotein translocase subunit SecA [Pseudomonadota bacterium]NIS69221.1 preprotein translocase subunit SecA [Pseudomonadota bacterium]
MPSILRKVVGTKNDRELRRIQPMVEQISALEPSVQRFSNAELRTKTNEFRERIDRGEPLDSILFEAFAVVREASRRTLGERHFDVQLIGGIVLHEGRIAEMATGEGKTLVATLPAYVNALGGRGVHIITVNDYLAKRDSEWMGAIYNFLGLGVGVIHHGMDQDVRKEAYRADITYGTNTEFGFDYLRDNMAIDGEGTVQREHNYAIVDEVDSILIDEARTPLIISGPVERSTHHFKEVKGPVERLVQSQSSLVNRFLSEAERIFREEEETYEGGIRLLQVKRGTPKNKRFLNMMEEPRYKKLVDRIELDFIRDKRMDELDGDLFYSIDEKSNVCDLTERGRRALSPGDPNFFVLPDLSQADTELGGTEEERIKKRRKLEKDYAEKAEKIHNITQLLKAYSLFEKDVEYVVSDGQVIIVDEFTGRLLPGRRYSDGLHQAIEAKEGVSIERENQTLATITIQNYFRMYEKLAGMTGTADTEAPEFHKIYKLDVVVIPTNMPMIRNSYPDVIYKTEREKFRAVADEIEELNQEGHPVLVGTVSIEKSERLSNILKKRGIRHHVLNAKHHQGEAEIIAQAGRVGAVTISTNMAGRGTDILLGGNPKFLAGGSFAPDSTETVDQEALEKATAISVREKEEVLGMGGLHVIGTERHESRRIDNQLRGRAGRQGDPGSSRFYLSLEDDLMRIFGSERIANVMERLGIEEDQPIEHRFITKAIENAQKKVEAHNFDIREHLLKYDNVMNKQREVIYTKRGQVLTRDDLKDMAKQMMEEVIDDLIEVHTDEKSYPEEWDMEGLKREIYEHFQILLNLDHRNLEELRQEDLRELVLKAVYDRYEEKEAEFGEPLLRRIEKVVMLDTIDHFWKEHLLGIDQLKEGIGLRGYGQKDPLIEYQKEGYEMFLDTLEDIRRTTVRNLFRFSLAREEEEERRPEPQRVVFSRGEMPELKPQEMAMAAEAGGKRSVETVRREGRKIGRNEPCPCGSGKKYKKCCGRNV